MSVRSSLGSTVAVCLLSRAALAQAPTKNQTAIGVWRGSSICLVRPSPCKDETVVYRIARVGAGDSLSIDARKIVNGQEEAMGDLACGFDASKAQVTCSMPNGVWRFTVRGDSLNGKLMLPDSTTYRSVRTARARS